MSNKSNKKNKRNVPKTKNVIAVKKKEYVSNDKNGNNTENNILLSEYNITQEQMIAIHEEAYYRAIKRLQDEGKQTEREIPKKKYKWYDDIFFFMNVYFFPWKICKKYTIKNTIYDSVLVLFVSLILTMIGGIMWLLGLIGTGWQAYQLLIRRNIIEFESLMLMVVATVFGSFFILAGKQFEKETDSAKIYAYSASIIALVSCVVAVIALFFTAK